ncbi:hypothetical protein M569_07506, partial [Genlisea aurea]
FVVDCGNQIPSSYFIARCYELKTVSYARKVFDHFPDRSNASLWNVMSKGYLRDEAFVDVIVLFRDMMRAEVKPNRYSLPLPLKSCCAIPGLKEGEQLHCLSVKNGFKSNVYVGTNLIDLYSGFAKVGCAHRVFTEMALRNVVSWTAMMDCYAANGDLLSARSIFDVAPERDIVMWNRLFSSYIENGDLMESRRLFDMIPYKDVISYNTMLNGYANNGDVASCEKLFNSMKHRNIFSWNALIAGYTHNGHFVEALHAFKTMLRDGDVPPNDATLVSVLTSCARLAALDFGKSVHVYADDNGYGNNVFVCNGLIEMYAKCGCVNEALSVFRGMIGGKDQISWNTMINSLAVHGHAADALRLFDEMKCSGETPNGITFTGVLNACSHMGLVEDGLEYFRSMREFSVEAKIEHYGCVVDLLARKGLLDQAVEFVDRMAIPPDGVIWTTLLAASRVHRRLELAELCLRKLVEIDPENPANYVMLSNVYGEARKWDGLARLKVASRDTGSKKQPGFSAVETEDGIVEFFASDKRHPKTEAIYDALGRLTELLR